ncbi:MAG: M3 family oligoendopeptidase [Cyanobacteria bacterium J06598_3]
MCLLFPTPTSHPIPVFDFGYAQPPDFGSAQPPDFGSAQPPDFGSAQSPDFGSAQLPDFGSAQLLPNLHKQMTATIPTQSAQVSDRLRPLWDNTQFFEGTSDPQIANTIETLKGDITSLAALCEPFTAVIETAETLIESEYGPLIENIRSIHHQEKALGEKLSNVSTYIFTALSTDTQDPHANSQKPVLQKLFADLAEATTPMDVFLLRASDDFIKTLLADPTLAERTFSIYHRRKLKDQLLSVAEEKLITGLSTNGLHAWGNLYTTLAGTLKCTVKNEEIGLAKAANLLSSAEADTRKAAWDGIRSAWRAHQPAVAAGLNAINGWRLEETQKRSGNGRKLHYLDKSCHQSRIARETLDALIETTYQNRAIGHRALAGMAKALGQAQMNPWDVMAPAPAAGKAEDIPFAEAIDLIANAFNSLTPAMGEFAVMMTEKGWIDGQLTPNRATGAYCTKFASPREPRIFMTYEGTMSNVITLAHELGHAWHNWVMRDLSKIESSYSMTLAETASIFAETLVRDALMQRATTPAQQLEIAWEDASSAAVFLLNIPARFEFEKRMVEARKVGAVRPEQLRSLMSESWEKWFENSLSGYDDLFWASKLHFSISGLGFYNYPYLFGYLFSLGIYAQQPVYGAHFNERYTELLRDTGTMTAEDLVQQHLQKDLRSPQFWQDSLDIVETSVARFEQLVEQTKSSPKPA